MDQAGFSTHSIRQSWAGVGAKGKLPGTRATWGAEGRKTFFQLNCQPNCRDCLISDCQSSSVGRWRRARRWIGREKSDFGFYWCSIKLFFCERCQEEINFLSSSRLRSVFVFSLSETFIPFQFAVLRRAQYYFQISLNPFADSDRAKFVVMKFPRTFCHPTRAKSDEGGVLVHKKLFHAVERKSHFEW